MVYNFSEFLLKHRATYTEAVFNYSDKSDSAHVILPNLNESKEHPTTFVTDSVIFTEKI